MSPCLVAGETIFRCFFSLFFFCFSLLVLLRFFNFPLTQTQLVHCCCFFFSFAFLPLSLSLSVDLIGDADSCRITSATNFSLALEKPTDKSRRNCSPRVGCWTCAFKNKRKNKSLVTARVYACALSRRSLLLFAFLYSTGDKMHHVPMNLLLSPTLSFCLSPETAGKWKCNFQFVSCYGLNTIKYTNARSPWSICQQQQKVAIVCNVRLGGRRRSLHQYTHCHSVLWCFSFIPLLFDD